MQCETPPKQDPSVIDLNCSNEELTGVISEDIHGTDKLWNTVKVREGVIFGLSDKGIAGEASL